jgi:hypothetical protein
MSSHDSSSSHPSSSDESTSTHYCMRRHRRGAFLADGLGRIGTLAPSAIRGVDICASSFAN